MQDIHMSYLEHGDKADIAGYGRAFPGLQRREETQVIKHCQCWEKADISPGVVRKMFAEHCRSVGLFSSMTCASYGTVCSQGRRDGYENLFCVMTSRGLAVGFFDCCVILGLHYNYLPSVAWLSSLGNWVCYQDAMLSRAPER